MVLRPVLKPLLREKTSGQTIVIIALSMLVLLAIVGLAVDGGSAYALRRKAQNASDDAALAGGRLMLKYYDQMVLANPTADVPSSAAKEDAVRTEIDNYITSNKGNASTVEAYFVNANKEIVTVANGEDHGQGQCGSAPGLTRPCQVGENSGIPWQRGIVGVTLLSRVDTPSIFVGVLGWDRVGGAARSTAFIFVTTSTGDINVQPIAIFRRPENYQEFQFDQIYTLIDDAGSQGSGSWGWVDWNGEGSSATNIKSLINCGFNPGTLTHAAWVARCPAFAGVVGEGPTLHYASVPPAGTYLPSTTEQRVPFLKYGPGMTGWWVNGSTGAVISNCKDFQDKVMTGTETENYGGVMRSGITFYVPIFDNTYQPGGSTSLRFHLRQIVKFFFRKPVGSWNSDPDPDVSCNPRTAPTATVCALCTPYPTPTPASQSHWFIRGKAKSFYSNNASGELGDLRSSFGHLVVLDR